jgi:hypothetical protein
MQGMSPNGPATPISWVPAADGYSLALDGTTLICRNPKGTVLKSVPSAVRKGDDAEALLALRDWLVRHDTACRSAVETWMLRSLPVPRSVLAGVWADPAWSAALRDLVVRGADASGASIAGLLREVTADDVGVVTLDGETRRLVGGSITIPHPILLDDLDDSREFLGEIGASQVVPQLFRETFIRPPDLDPDLTSVDTWAGARFKELRHVLSRCATLGFRVSGGFATVRVWEDGVPVESRYWVGADEPSVEAETGPLVFMDARSRPMRLGDVGPVAWSEGSRMAALIAAGRVQQDDVEAGD